jgi:hypothetical protein
MRVICDAPGQTCNRLWTYVTSVARSVAERKPMVIIFYDWTIECFPHLLHCPFIYFPLWHKWYLERGNGWNNYKGLTWKVTHDKRWDRVFRLLGFKKGWYTMDDTRYLKQTKKELQHIFQPREDIVERARQMVAELRQEADLVVGVHIRHGDYRTFYGGRYFYTLEEYHQMMLRIVDAYPGRRVSFFISSNEPFDISLFEGCRCRRFGAVPNGDITDLTTLSMCDRILGPWSTYSRWASFIGEVPLCFIEHKDQAFTDDSFSTVTDFFHFANGKSTEDYWKPTDEEA